jgi:hypothetical protein
VSGFEIVPAELRAAGKRLGELADECAVQSALRYSAKPGCVGDPLLAVALEAFQTSSGEAVKELAGDLGELGARLERAARMFDEHEREHQVRLDIPAPEPFPRPSGDIAAALG